jgi:hypothetical protein
LSTAISSLSSDVLVDRTDELEGLAASVERQPTAVGNVAK